MSLTTVYDHHGGALYIRLSGNRISRSVEVDAGVSVVDLDSEGQVVGIEVLDASGDFGLPRVAARFGLMETLGALQEAAARAVFEDLATSPNEEN